MPKSRPNILIFMTDQQRGDTVLPGSPAKMPNLARFRDEGVTFSQTFCPSPHCCPARATFFSGLYPSQHGVWNNVLVHNTLSPGLKPGVRLWSEDLSAAGYDLHWSGKWHLSRDEGPSDRGWRVHSLTGGPASATAPGSVEQVWEGYRRLAETERRGIPVDESNGGSVRGDGQILRPGYGTYTHYGINENPFNDEGQVDAAVAALADQVPTDQPWAMYVGTLGPHDPYIVPQRFVDMYNLEDIELPDSFFDVMGDKPSLYRKTRTMFDQLSPEEHRKALLHYYAFCSYQDYLFGRVLEALEQTGQRDNTIVVFCSDHGDYGGEHGLWCKGLPCFRGAYHVPAIVRWPAGVTNPGRTVDELVSLADFGPTFLECAGIAARPMAGSSLVAFLADRSPQDWRSELFTQSNGNELYGIQRAVFSKTWKFVYNGFDFEELYNLSEDPAETINLYNSTSESTALDVLSREMMQKIWRFAADHNDDCINPYIMVSLAPVGPAAAFY